MSKFRRQEGLFLAEGFKVVQELLQSSWKIHAILVMEEKQQWRELLTKIPQEVAIYRLTASQWKRLSQDKTPEGIMAVVSSPRPQNIDEIIDNSTGNLLLLHRIGNPNNLGSLMRTARWFGFSALILSAGSVDIANPKVVRVSMGSLFHLDVMENVSFEELLPLIRGRFYLIGSHVRAGRRPHFCNRRTAILLGSESHGLPETLLSMVDEQWFIPGMAGADSLSLASAAAIMMYACTRSFSER
jgi:TrmH family RNA methyltransferase